MGIVTMKYTASDLFLGTSILFAAISTFIVTFTAGLGYRISQSEVYYTNAAGTSLANTATLILTGLALSLLLSGFFYFYPLVRQRAVILTPYHALPVLFLMPGLVLGLLVLWAASTYGLTL